MLKIGIADYYLDNWHANHYPDFLREVISRMGYDAELTYAYGLYPGPAGTTNEQWCAEHNMKPSGSMQELVNCVDAIMVIAADDSRWHEEVCELPLKSGKPVFVDKTFAPDVAAAKRMFLLAEAHGTPVFSSSAQRYCQDILDWQAEHPVRPRFVSTAGPHSLDNYAVHQLEPIVALMGRGVQRLKAFAVGSAVTQLILDYGDGRLASFVQSPQPWAEFHFMVSDGETGKHLVSDDRNFYHNLAEVILDFFTCGVAPVPKEETLEIVAVIETARQARKMPDTWFQIRY
ncbi:MAG: Gfo/Idh/MocA family oxidoreductase [Lachnospiraceae bacterium]|nr:Gfo/Idh/MocA family oxidoreductase [Lachnospiraceae bacterium]